MSATKSVARHSADSIVARVRKEILDGTLPPGLQLRQEALAGQFGVSRIPVRDALRSLEAEGLIRHERFKGAIVAKQTLGEILEMLDIRVGLETRALKLALPRLSKSDFAGAEAILERYDSCSSPRVWSDLNLAFHLSLYRPSGNARLVKMIEDVVRGTDRFIRTQISMTTGKDGPQADHRALLDACRKGARVRAIELLEKHIEHTKERLLKASSNSDQTVDWMVA